MEIVNLVTAEEVISALNIEPPSPSSYGQFLGKYAAGAQLEAPVDFIICEWESRENRPSAGGSWFISNYLLWAPTIVAPSLSTEEGWRMPDTIDRKDSAPIGAALTSAHLRQRVDEWLDTGRRLDGSERPKGRKISSAQNWWLAVQKYLEDNPMTFTPILNTDGFHLEVAEPRWDVRGARDFFSAQVQSALRLFVGVLASDWKERLCKCRYAACGRYFIHPKPRNSYEHGTFCRHEHASHAAGKELVRSSRRRATQELIGAAARKLLRYRIGDPQWQDDSGIKRRLAAELCHVIAARRLESYRQEVRLNWITHHRLAIEQKRVELSAR